MTTTYTKAKLYKKTKVQLKDMLNKEFGIEIYYGPNDKFAYFTAVCEELEKQGRLEG